MLSVPRFLLLASLAWSSLACDALSGLLPAAPPALKAEGSPEQPKQVDFAASRLAFALQSAKSRLAEEMPPPQKFLERTCPDASIGAGRPSPRALELSLAVADARYEARHLLPLDLTERLAPPRKLEDRFFRPAAPGQAPQLLSDGAGRQLEVALKDLSEVRYKGVYTITLYQAPRLIWKKGASRRSWRPGLLRTWLSIYDIDQSELLCQTELIVKNDIDGEPISRRRERDTEARLVSELAEAAIAETPIALARISQRLRLPEAEAPGVQR